MLKTGYARAINQKYVKGQRNISYDLGLDPNNILCKQIVSLIADRDQANKKKLKH
jgi:hypothetical protein